MTSYVVTESGTHIVDGTFVHKVTFSKFDADHAAQSAARYSLSNVAGLHGDSLLCFCLSDLLSMCEDRGIIIQVHEVESTA
jgi:hypothetical protein